MKFCSQCGHSVELRIPPGDDRRRHVCPQCHTIHYQNPRLIVGCLPLAGERVLLCRRAIEPRRGFWTLPAGFMENGERTVEGAARETWEEARARVEHEQLYRIFDLPHIDQVYMFYRADVVDGEFGVGPESSEAALFAEHEIPWHELSFPVVVETLREFFADRRRGDYPVRVSGLDPSWAGWLQRAPDTGQ